MANATEAGNAAIVAEAGNAANAAYVPRLKTQYVNEIRTQLKESLALPNVMMVPRMEKIVLNMGVGQALTQPKLIEGAVADLTLISGQKPVVTRAKKSIAGFKLRQGNAIGAMVTLRRRPHVGILRPAREPGDSPCS